MFVVVLVLIAVINAALIVAVRPLPRAPRARAGPVRRRARRPAAGARRCSACSRSRSSSSASCRPTTPAQIEPAGPERALGARRPRRSGSRACRRSRSPRRRSRRAAASRSAARSRPRPARCRSTRSPSSGCGGSSTRAARPGTGRSPTASWWSRSTRRWSSTSPRPTSCTAGGCPRSAARSRRRPATIVQTWFKADEVGRYAGRSTIFSGTSFPAMRAWVRVVTVPEYQAYVEQLAEGPHRGAGDHRPRTRRRPARRAAGGRRVSAPPRTAAGTRPEVVTRELRKPRQAWIERATSADHKIVAPALHRHRARPCWRSRRPSSCSCGCS